MSSAIPVFTVEELRRAASDKALDIGLAWALLEAAADEIERLQADLETARERSRVNAADLQRWASDRLAALLGRDG